MRRTAGLRFRCPRKLSWQRLMAGGRGRGAWSSRGAYRFDWRLGRRAHQRKGFDYFAPLLSKGVVAHKLLVSGDGTLAVSD